MYIKLGPLNELDNSKYLCNVMPLTNEIHLLYFGQVTLVLCWNKYKAHSHICNIYIMAYERKK